MSKRQGNDKTRKRAAELAALPRDIWKDPNVQAALKEGRSADDIMVLRCPQCAQYGYYNEGSHFSCRFCDCSWYCWSAETEPEPAHRPFLRLDESDCITLADTVTETTDGYDNQTQ